MSTHSTPHREDLARLEATLVRIRWFATAFGLFQVWQGATVPPLPPAGVISVAYALVALLGLGNVAIWLGLRREHSLDGLRRIGLAAFILDIVVVTGTCWAYSYDRYGATWVLAYVLPLEGAMRYQLRGALAAVAVAFATELAREAYRTHLFPDLGFHLSSVTFRVGVMALVALVAGMMARSLAEQARAAERRARAFEDLARRERAARRELSAFHDTVLAGIGGQTPQEALQLMADSIGSNLGYESLCILAWDDDDLREEASFGDRHRHDDPVTQATLVAAARTQRPQLTDGGRQMAVAMAIGGKTIGVIHVQAAFEGGLGDGEVEALRRLADQVALVAEGARLHAERAQTVERLEELARLKSDFVAITSHELRTPLTGIRGFASILFKQHDTLSPEERIEYLGIVDQQSARLSRLVEDLLVVTKLDDGRLKLSIREAEVEPFVHGVVASFAGEAARIHVVSEEAPRWARFDPDRVEQVLRNLVHNALKFSAESDPVVVRVGLADEALLFEVADRGVGMSTDQRERIFDRFHQAGNGHRREKEGVGPISSRRAAARSAHSASCGIAAAR